MRNGLLLIFLKRYLKKYWVIFIIFAFFGLMSAKQFDKSITPIYQSTAIMFIATPISGSASANDLSPNSAINGLAQGSSFSLQRVLSYANILNSEANLLPVIDRLKLNISFEDLASQVTTTVDPNTVLIKVTVSNPSAKSAKEIVDAVASQFSKTAKSLEILDSQEALSPVKVSTVQYGQLPNSPTSPKKSRDSLIGLVLGLALGAALIRIFGLLDRRVKNDSQLGGIPLLGTIRFDSQFKTQPTIANLNTHAERAESFRAIRGNINFLRGGRKDFIVVVTSTLPKEGKSTTSLNLGLTFAMAGISTIIIESDMRRPSISGYCVADNITFQKDSNGGLSELLSAPVPINIKSLRNHVNVVVKQPKLAIMFAGKTPPNPSELMASERMSKLLDVAASFCEIVIVDTPPVGLVSDAAGIASKAAARILLVAAGQTKVEEFKVAIRVMENIGEGFDGVILNKIPKKRNNEYGYAGDTYGGYATLSHDYMNKKYTGYYDVKAENAPELTHKKSLFKFILGEFARIDTHVKKITYSIWKNSFWSPKFRNSEITSSKNSPESSFVATELEIIKNRSEAKVKTTSRRKIL